MSITKSYNKYTDTTYVYDTDYVWNEDKHRKVQKRKCIGKLDKETGKIIPTNPMGRPRKTVANLASKNNNSQIGVSHDDLGNNRLQAITTSLRVIHGALADLISDLDLLGGSASDAQSIS